MAPKPNKKTKTASKFDWGGIIGKMDLRKTFSLVILLLFIINIAISVHPSSPFRPIDVYVDSINIGSEDSNILLESDLFSKTISVFPEQLTINVWKIAMHPDLASAGYKACLDRITTRIGTSLSPSRGTYTYPQFSVEDKLGEPACVQYVEGSQHDYDSYTRFFIEWEESIPTSYLDVGGYYVYPYDKLTLFGDFIASGRIYDEAGLEISTFSIPVTNWVNVRLPEWKIESVKVNSDNTSSETQPGILLKRSLLIRILTPLILLLIFIITVVVLYVDNISSAIELMLVLIFGIWGIRQIIIPTDFSGTTAVDMILLGEYVAIAFALIARIIINATHKNTPPSPKS